MQTTGPRGFSPQLPPPTLALKLSCRVSGGSRAPPSSLSWQQRSCGNEHRRGNNSHRHNSKTTHLCDEGQSSGRGTKAESEGHIRGWVPRPKPAQAGPHLRWGCRVTRRHPSLTRSLHPSLLTVPQMRRLTWVPPGAFAHTLRGPHPMLLPGQVCSSLPLTFFQVSAQRGLPDHPIQRSPHPAAPQHSRHPRTLCIYFSILMHVCSVRYSGGQLGAVTSCVPCRSQWTGG